MSRRNQANLTPKEVAEADVERNVTRWSNASEASDGAAARPATLPNALLLFNQFKADSARLGNQYAQQLSEESINDIFSGRLTRREMEPQLAEIGSRGDNKALIKKIIDLRQPMKNGEAFMALSSSFSAYLCDRAYFLGRAIKAKTEQKTQLSQIQKLGRMASRKMGADPTAIPKPRDLLTHEDRPKIPTTEEINSAIQEATLPHILTDAPPRTHPELTHRHNLSKGSGGQGPNL